MILRDIILFLFSDKRVYFCYYLLSSFAISETNFNITKRNLDMIRTKLVIALGLILLWKCTAEELSQVHTIQYEFINFQIPSSIHTSGEITFRNPLWEIDFSKNIFASFNHPSLSIFGTPKKFILKLWASSEGSELELLLASHFQFFRKKIGTLYYGEQTIEFNAPPEGWEYFSGENDGKVRTPLRFIQLQINRAHCPSNTLQLQIQSFICETEIPSHQECILISKTYTNNQGIYSSCSFTNLLDKDVSGELFIQIKDWEENILSSSSQKWTIPPSAQSIQSDIPLSIPDNKNFIEIVWTFKRDDGKTFTAISTYSREINYPMDKTLNPNSPWGMGLYFLRYGSDQKSREKSAQIASQAGIKWTREDFAWSHIEPEPGKFDFAYYDNIVNTANAYGISVYGILCYWAPWTEPYTMKGVEDFVRYAEATVNHFKDRVKFWEIYNEPNIFFWQGPKELYPELVKRCYDVIKKVDPEAQILAISTSGIDNQFIDFCLKADTPFDILTIHPYRRTLDDVKFIDELKRVAQQVQNRPVWITEMGWSNHLWKDGVTEREQALLFARCYLSAIASGVVQNISWYDFRNDGNDPFYFEYNFGIVHEDFSPKPALRACTNICRNLPNKDIQTRIDFGEDVIAFQQGTFLVLWSIKEDKCLRVKVNKSPIQIQNLMGEVIKEESKSKYIYLPLKKGYPLFITQGEIKGIK